jgi:hypothetical protein
VSLKVLGFGSTFELEAGHRLELKLQLREKGQNCEILVRNLVALEGGGKLLARLEVRLVHSKF